MRKEARTGGVDSAALSTTLERGGDTEGIPPIGTTAWINGADGGTTGGVVTEGGLAAFEAGASAEGTALKIAAAVEIRKVSTDFVPVLNAAEFVNVADRGTATDVVAARLGCVDGSGLEATSLARTLPARTRRDTADVDRQDSATVVPLHAAAQRVDGADRVAAGGVVAHRGRLGLFAVADARALVKSGADDRCRFDAIDVPFIGAAVFKPGNGAHRGGAILVVASRSGVSLVARVASADVERDIAHREGLGGTDRIPADFAAPGVVVFADALAAGSITASRCETLDEAVSSLGIATTLIPAAEVRVEGGGDRTGPVPACKAAERIDRADFLAAILVRARRSGMRGEAGTGVHVAAFGADFLGEFDAGFIPRVITAERLDDADAFATGFVVAVGIRPRDVAASGEDLAAEWVLLGAQLFGAVGANLIPANLAAERIYVADGVAAISVFAPGSVLRLKGAGFEAGTVERSEGDDFGAAAALFIERLTSRGGD